MNPETGLPEVDPDKCTACGACVKACPKMVIELRKKWPKNRAVYVSCVSKDKGAVVMKACKAGCIGCGKCEKVCAFGAITVENNLAYIDPQKCKPRLHRPAEVQTLPQVRERVPDGSHQARRHGSAAQGAESPGRPEGCSGRRKGCCKGGSEGCSGRRKGCCKGGSEGCSGRRKGCCKGGSRRSPVMNRKNR